MKWVKALYIRNFVFGVEDSLASTVGLLSGIATAGVNASTIVVTGAVLIFVEAFSMGVGSFMSEESAEEYVKRRDVSSREPLIGSLVMFASYVFSGFVPLLPYLFWEINTALKISVGLSLVCLFILGMVGAEFSKTSKFKHGVKMLLTGGGAIIAGVVVGGWFKV